MARAFSTLLAVVVLTVGCRTRAPIEGRLVVGASARTVGMEPGDTLRESAPESMAEDLVASAQRHAQELGYAPNCTRYFIAEDRVVALFAHFCGDRYGSEFDARDFIVLTSSGEVVDSIRWYTDEFVEVVPYLRLNQIADTMISGR